MPRTAKHCKLPHLGRYEPGCCHSQHTPCRKPTPPTVSVNDVRANRVGPTAQQLACTLSPATHACRQVSHAASGALLPCTHCPVSRLQIRLQIKSSFASPFNVEQFEVEWAPLDSEQWTSIG